MIQQAGAVPIRIQNDKPLFLVINNRNKTRWLVPKGIVENGHTLAGTAAKEAMEEAGVTGEMLAQPLGEYTYPKWDDICSVELFVLFVTKIYDNWEEDSFRERRWINWEEFSHIVDERIPRSILNKLPETLNFINNLDKKETRP
jgi:8-oxo-dGTP pyrophosphatase MutT (NUDIX family)